jgi:hypothetical protein
MARTYAWLKDGGPAPREVEIGNVIRRYGAGMVGVLSPKIVRRVVLVDRLRHAYTGMIGAENMAEWRAVNEDEAKLVDFALLLSQRQGNK